MARYRQIHTKIWTSPDFQELSPLAKLAFIYLFSNNHRNEAALYRITPKTISRETDMTLEEAQMALTEMEKVGVIKYDWDNHVVWVINAIRYQKISPNELKAIRNDLASISHPFIDELLIYYKDIFSSSEIPSKVLPSTSEVPPGKGKGKGKGKDKDKDNINTCSTNVEQDASRVAPAEHAEILQIQASQAPTEDKPDLSPPNGKELIAELVDMYRDIEGVTPTKGDYPFMGALYNEYGYAEVAAALNELTMVMATERIEKPLVYLKAILRKADRASPKIAKQVAGRRTPSLHGGENIDWGWEYKTTD